ncbi:MAG TPA: LytTR family DNA-binding domain-containing protein [Caulobacteraceae bacterium]
MSDTPSLFGTPREWATDLAIMTAIGVFLGVIGPFGSFDGGNVVARIAYWVANIWIGFLALSTIVRLAARSATRFDLPIWFVIAVGVAVGALPLAIVLRFFSAWVWPPNHGRMTPLFTQYAQTLALSEPLSFAYYFLVGRGWKAAAKRGWNANPDPAPRLAVAGGGGFLDRLPPRLGRDLLCLQMEDHYVRAHTASGSDLILTPLKDAIAELGATDGLQVHRSWWVARTAVAEPVTSGRNLALRLSNGLEVPVSRASVAKLRAAGWLGPA